MLTKRIIPCLDVKGGRVVKGTSFVELRDAGDPVELARFYYEQGADELPPRDETPWWMLSSASPSRSLCRSL